MSRVKVAVLVLGAFVLIGTAWVLRNQTTRSPRLRPGDSALVARGKLIYAAQCSSCHGKSLEGQPNWQSPLASGRLPAPPHDNSGHTWHHPDELLFRITKEGSAKVAGRGYKSDMTGFSEILTDPEIVAVLSYIKSTWPTEIKIRHDVLNRNSNMQ